MFGFDNVVNLFSDAIDVTVGVVTFGEYGDISQAKVARLAAAGISAALMAEAFGVAESVIEEMIN